MLLDYMRRRTKTFLYVLVPPLIIAFVAWGTTTNFGRNRGQTLIEIGDVKISEQDFLDRYRMIHEMAVQNFGENLTPELEEMLNLKQQALDDLIRDTLMEQEIKRLNIVISDDEVYDAIKRYPAFQTEGKFDPAKWNGAIAQPGINWAGLMEQERESLKRRRLIDMVQAAAWVTEDEVKDAYQEENEKAEIEFVALKATEFAADAEPSDEEISAFYEKHKEEYAVPSKIVLSYVEIKKEPSQADYDVAEQYCRKILERVRAGDDFAKLAEAYSDDDDTKANGGDRGFLDRKHLEKEYADAAFSMKPGEVSDVVKTERGFDIIKLEDIKGEGEEKKVRTRHILIKTEPGESTLTTLGETAVKVSAEAVESTLEKAAQDNGLSVVTTPEFSENSSVIPGLGMVKEITEILPGLTEGRTSDMIQTDKAFYVVRVDKRIPERVRELSEIEESIKAAAKAEKALTLAKAKAEEIVAKINETGTALSDIDGIPKPQQAELNRRGQAPGLPFVRGLANVIFQLPEGKAADPFISGGAAYIVVLKSKIEADPKGYEKQRDQTRDRILAERRRQVVDDYLKNLRENADVKINEELFERI